MNSFKPQLQQSDDKKFDVLENFVRKKQQNFNTGTLKKNACFCPVNEVAFLIGSEVKLRKSGAGPLQRVGVKWGGGRILTLRF